jgi:O-antigen ligase
MPLTGVGLGQQYLFIREPAELSNFVYWRYMTHDAVLWIWLKTGIAGFVAFWVLVAQTAIVGASLFRRLRSPDLKLVALVPVVLIAIQVVFSSVDLGLTYSRTMIVLGVSLGLTAYLTDAARAQEAAA